jgi:hypothetical protein
MRALWTQITTDFALERSELEILGLALGAI